MIEYIKRWEFYLSLLYNNIDGKHSFSKRLSISPFKLYIIKFIQHNINYFLYNDNHQINKNPFLIYG